MGGDRETIEAAFKSLWADQPAAWPPIAERIRAARLRKQLDPVTVSTIVGVTSGTYYDLEALDDEAFTLLTLAELARLCHVLDHSPRTLLLAEDDVTGDRVVNFEVIAERLRERLDFEGLGTEDLSRLIGWDIAAVLVDPSKLWDFSVVALNDVCRAAGIDWVAALPGTDKSPPVGDGPSGR